MALLRYLRLKDILPHVTGIAAHDSPFTTATVDPASPAPGAASTAGDSIVRLKASGRDRTVEMTLSARKQLESEMAQVRLDDPFDQIMAHMKRDLAQIKAANEGPERRAAE